MQLQVMMEVNLPEDLGSFQEAEIRIRESMFRAGQQMIQNLFDAYEQGAVPSKSVWIKDKRQKTYHTRVGIIRRDRLRVYDHRKKRYRYPLDEWLGIGSRQKATPGLQEDIVTASVQRSYRSACQEVNQWTGVSRSPMSNWKIVQKSAETLRARDAPVPDWYLKPLPEKDPSMKEDPCPILAIDPDGTYCHPQEKTAKDHDVKVAVLYTSKAPEGKNGKRWQLQNKQILFSQSSESVRDFFNRVTTVAMGHYGAHGNTQVIIHGDGDLWIKGLKNDYWDQALLRLDPWHVKKKIRMATGLTEFPSEWESSIYGNPDLLVSQLSMWRVAHTSPNTREREKMDEIIQYIKNNREGLLPSGISPEIKKQYPGMFRRGSGTIESNIGHGFNARFKLPRMSWSTKGLDNLVYLRERFLNGHMKPRFHVPQPLTRQRVAQSLGRALH